MPLTLTWKAATRLPVVADGLGADGVMALAPAEAARRTVRIGNAAAELGELFTVEGEPDGSTLVLEGDLRSVRGIGRGLATGRVVIQGAAGDFVGAAMTGGMIEVAGCVGNFAGAEMRGGLLRVRGDAGRFLGGAEPGSRSGMREGLILVDGRVGDDAGLAQRRGLIAILGPAGDGLGRGMIAGSIFAFGPVGPGAGADMKRGTLALFGHAEAPAPLLPTFHPSGRQRPPFVTVYLKALHDRGFRVPEAVLRGDFGRYNGDLARRGQGEILVWGPA